MMRTISRMTSTTAVMISGQLELLSPCASRMFMVCPCSFRDFQVPSPKGRGGNFLRLPHHHAISRDLAHDDPRPRRQVSAVADDGRASALGITLGHELDGATGAEIADGDADVADRRAGCDG